MAKKPRKITDKRKKGLGNNIPSVVSASGSGSAKPLAVFNDRRKSSMGKAKRAA